MMSPHPLRTLTETADAYRHLRAERAREGREGRWRRRQGQELADLSDRYEHLLARWVPEEDRAAWTAYLDGQRPGPPEEPPADPPPAFRGRSDDGALIEVFPTDDDRFEVRVDGQVERRPTDWDDEGTAEITDAPPEAVEALRRFVGTHGDAPWSWARALYAEGLIDGDFGLTARGRRVVDRAGGPIEERPRPIRWSPSV